MVQVRGVGPGQLEALVFDPARHVQLVGARRVRARGRVQAMVDRVDQAAGGERLVQPAEIVEADRRPGTASRVGAVGQADRRPGTASRVGAVGQVTQRAVTEPAVRDGPQLFLDRLQGRIPPAGRHAERDREDGGEPAHRPGQVAARQQVLLAAVALQIDQHPFAAGPAGQHPAQRGQQHVIDLGPVGARHVLQQRPGLAGAQRDRDRPGGGGGVRPVTIGRQDRGGAADHAGPVVPLTVEPAGLRAGGQPQRPVPERGRLRAQVHRPAAGQLRIGRGQVIKQDPPRHPVHHQMVGGQQQHRPPPAAPAEQHPAQQRPRRQVKPGQDRTSGLLNHHPLPVPVQPGQIPAV